MIYPRTYCLALSEIGFSLWIPDYKHSASDSPMTRKIIVLGVVCSTGTLSSLSFRSAWFQKETLQITKKWVLMELLTGPALWVPFWPHHFLSCSLFLRMSANSSATHIWLSNILTGGLSPWFVVCLPQETQLFDVSNWICFKIGCLNSENLPPPPVQPIQRSWWLLMYSVEISTLITAPLVRQGLPFPGV